MADIKLRLAVMKPESNLENHIRWFEYIAGRAFIIDWYQAVERPGFLQTLVDSARKIVEEDIYSKNTTAGTGRIKDSFTGVNERNEQGTNLIVYSDPSVAPSKGPFRSGVPGAFSYAAFFEDSKFNTFLPPQDDPHDSRRFRPFYFSMQLAQSKLSNEGVVRRIFQMIRKHMPRIGN